MALDKRMSCCLMYQTILWANSGWPHLGVFPLTLKEKGEPAVMRLDPVHRAERVGLDPRVGREMLPGLNLISEPGCLGEDTALVQLCARSAARALCFFKSASNSVASTQPFSRGWDLQVSLLDWFHTLPRWFLKNIQPSCKHTDEDLCLWFLWLSPQMHLVLSLGSSSSLKLLLLWPVCNGKNLVDHFGAINLFWE